MLGKGTRKALVRRVFVLIPQLEMLFSALLVAASIFAVSFAAKKDFSYDSSSESSIGSISDFSSNSFSEPSFASSSAPSVTFYDSSISSDASSSVGSFSASVCRQALKNIEAQPKGAAFAYFSSLEKRIRKQSALWLNPNTQVEAVENFATQYGVQVSLSTAFGQITYPTDAAAENVNFAEVYRSWALNSAVLNQSGSGRTYYAFHIFDKKTAEFIEIGLSQATNALPKNQLCFRKAGLNRLY